MEVLCHHLYEFKKGLRNLVLFTCSNEFRDAIVERMEKNGIDYYITEIDGKKINTFFGKQECVETVKRFSTTRLNLLTPEEDFILGIMLGYDMVQQCDRFNEKKDDEATLKAI